MPLISDPDGLSQGGETSVAATTFASQSGAQIVITSANVPAVTAGDYIDSLAVAGRDGTLRRRFRGSKVRNAMVGKTGTLTGVIALSGLLEHEGRKLVFAIVTNGNAHRNRWNVRKQHEALVEAMHRYLSHVHLASAATTPGTSE